MDLTHLYPYFAPTLMSHGSMDRRATWISYTQLHYLVWMILATYHIEILPLIHNHTIHFLLSLLGVRVIIFVRMIKIPSNLKFIPTNLDDQFD